jgi:hypothetical protein
MGNYMLDVNVTRTPTGIEETATNSNVQVYPNPASDKINVNLSKINGTASVHIIDLQGRTVFQSSYDGDKLVAIPVSTISNGMYFVRIQSEQGTVTEKISINR